VRSGIKTVVLDTNALLMPFQFKINIDREIGNLLGGVEVIVPSSVIIELRRLKDRHAKAALSLSGKYRIVDVKKRGDAGVIEAAEVHHAAVITNDQELIEILRKASIPAIRMRECQRLDFV
jgi:rRNA-processing protein FCF1